MHIYDDVLNFMSDFPEQELFWVSFYFWDTETFFFFSKVKVYICIRGEPTEKVRVYIVSSQ